MRHPDKNDLMSEAREELKQVIDKEYEKLQETPKIKAIKTVTVGLGAVVELLVSKGILTESEVQTTIDRLEKEFDRKVKEAALEEENKTGGVVTEAALKAGKQFLDKLREGG